MSFKKILIVLLLGLGVPFVAFKLGGFMAERYEEYSSLPSKDQVTLTDQFHAYEMQPFPVTTLKQLVNGRSAWVAVNSICVDQDRHVWIDIDTPVFSSDVGDLYVTRKGSSFIVQVPTDKYESMPYIYRWWPQSLPIASHQFQPVDEMKVMNLETCQTLRQSR